MGWLLSSDALDLESRKLQHALQLQLSFVLKLRLVLKAVIAGLASH
jgi:hypothetical protein